MLAGSERPEVRALRARLAADAPGSATMLATGWPTSDPRSAALVNGIAARSHTRTGRQRCSVQSSPHRDCAASMPPPSGWRCASARR
jgi:hypothetical protein